MHLYLGIGYSFLREKCSQSMFSLNFFQEQIGELLDIKSFSRKFPDLSRRKIEPNERDYLMETYNIQKIMNEAREFFLLFIILF